MHKTIIQRTLCSSLLITFICLLTLYTDFALAETAAPNACPVFHCNSEATSAMSLNIETVPHPVFWQNNTSGNLTAQGCSGDGNILACLYSSDKSGSGTLKVFDPISKKELWGTRKRGSYNLNALTAGIGQVPFITSDDRILASDYQSVALYSSTGEFINKMDLPAGSVSLSFGIIGLSNNIGLVNQKGGMLTAFDLDQLTIEATIQLKTSGGVALSLSSPVSAHQNRVYAAAQEKGTDLVNSYLKVIELTNNTLIEKWSYAYRGVTGASPIVISPQISGRTYPILLLHSPAPAGSSTAKDQLIAIEDQGNSFKILWTLPLSGPIEVAPLINPVSKVFYLQIKDSSSLDIYNFNGTRVSTINIRSLTPSGMNWSDFLLNGHLVGTFTNYSQTIFLSGGGTSGQYVMGLNPSTKTLSWVTKTYSSKEKYTGAWTIQERREGNCPIVVGPDSGISVLCPQ